MYTTIDFKTKKKLREALKRGETVSVFQPGPFPGKSEGTVALEGPHYPAAHTWYATATICRGKIIGGIK